MKVYLGKCGSYSGCNSPTMGLFGLSWTEKVAKKMIEILNGTGYESNLKSFWGPSGHNTGLVKTLKESYTSLMVEGNKPPVFSAGLPDAQSNYLAGLLSSRTNQPEIVSLAFLRALYSLTQSGTIDYSLYDPMGWKSTVETVKEAEPKTGITAVIEDTGKTLNKVLIVGGIAAGAYLLANLNKFTKKR